MAWCDRSWTLKESRGDKALCRPRRGGQDESDLSADTAAMLLATPAESRPRYKGKHPLVSDVMVAYCGR